MGRHSDGEGRQDSSQRTPGQLSTVEEEGPQKAGEGRETNLVWAKDWS